MIKSVKRCYNRNTTEFSNGKDMINLILYISFNGEKTFKNLP